MITKTIKSFIGKKWSHWGNLEALHFSQTCPSLYQSDETKNVTKKLFYGFN
jgi:hypothetical protein